jgi:hypothetical protein
MTIGLAASASANAGSTGGATLAPLANAGPLVVQFGAAYRTPRGVRFVATQPSPSNTRISGRSTASAPSEQDSMSGQRALLPTSSHDEAPANQSRRALASTVARRGVARCAGEFGNRTRRR